MTGLNSPCPTCQVPWFNLRPPEIPRTSLVHIYIYDTTKSHRKAGAPPGRDDLEAQKGALWTANFPVGMGRGKDNSLAQLQWEIERTWYGLSPAKGNPCLWAVVQLDAEATELNSTRKGHTQGEIELQTDATQSPCKGHTRKEKSNHRPKGKKGR